MSPCYYCGSKHHTIRQCNADWRQFIIWEEMFDYEVGYMGIINCNSLSSFKKKTLMRIACLENVSRVQKISPDGKTLECSPVNIKLNQGRDQLLYALVDRYNNNKEVLEEFRKKHTIYTSEDCPICYDKLGDAVCTTKCGHKFCTDCFVQTIRRLPQGACCPMCRASLIPKQEDNEPANRYRTGERPVNISWAVDRNPDPVRRLFSEEDYMRGREEFIRDREEEEVGF